MRPQQATPHVRSLSSVELRTLRLCLYLTVTALIWAIGLIVLGALVSATNSAAQCSGWPLCNGQFSPAADTQGSLIFSHRFGGFIILLLSTTLVGLTQIRLKRSPTVTRLAAGAFVLVLAQAVVGGFAVVQNLPAFAVSLHLVLAFFVAGALAAMAVIIRARLTAHETANLMSLAAPTTLVGHLRAMAVVLIGTLVVSSHADGAVAVTASGVRSALGAPGGAFSFQITGGALVVLLAGTFLGGLRHSRGLSQATYVTASVAGLATVAAILAGLVTSTINLPAATSVLPVALAAIGWSAAIALLTGTQVNRDAPLTMLPDQARLAAILRDFARVSKPGIMVLLLVTTLGAMLIAQQGWPSPGLILLTLFGGALASGGASALNCYYDRDIDGVMARTRKRPIPTGGLTPDQVRAWGLSLSVLSVVVLAVFVNPLAATLALGGNLFYVLVYTRKLKRSTPQNIVIGGAAGSFPPLVGWAAVTGSLSLGAFLIAAIIFYWTPPHFWSLALLKANDYKRAGIPMLPVTHGDHETRRRIVLYSFLLVAVTLLMVPAGVVGLVYGAVAATLGAWFVVMAIRMYREKSSRLAWPLFKYSNYYLAALLAAMAIDHAFRF